MFSIRKKLTERALPRRIRPPATPGAVHACQQRVRLCVNAATLSTRAASQVLGGFRQRDSHVCVCRADDCHAFGDNKYVCVQITRVTNRPHARIASRDHLSESSLVGGNGPANHTHLARPRCEGYHQIKDAIVRVLDIVSVRERTRSERACARRGSGRAGGK